MDDLIAFLSARVEEDRASEWPHRPNCQMLKRPPTGFPFDNYSCNCDAATRWLLEIEAKRAIVDAHRPGPAFGFGGPPPVGHCRACRQAQFPCYTMRQLASVYAGHARYRMEWKP